MYRRPGLYAVLTALALTACATPRTADLSLPGGYEAPAGAPAGAIALDTWWTAYGDPELTSLVEQALLRNPDVRTARSRLDEVKAQRTSAILQYLPQGDATAQGRRTDTRQIGGSAASIPGFSTDGVSKQYSAGFDVSWELDPWGRALFAYRAADAEVDRVRYSYETTRAQIAADTADAWFQARGLAIQLADARETARIQQDLYDLAGKRAANGLAATTEPDRIAGDLAQAQAQIAGLEAQLQVQKRAILILAGRVVEPTASINATPEVGQAPAVPAALPSDLLQRRPDVPGTGRDFTVLDDATIQQNLMTLSVRFWGSPFEPTELTDWTATFKKLAARAKTVNKPEQAWGSVCVAMMTDPRFITY